MSDEETFDKLIKQVKEDLKEVKFLKIKLNLKVKDPNNVQRMIYIDNLVQTNLNIFIFEAKSKKEEKAVSQLQNYNESLQIFKSEMIKEQLLFPFNTSQIRLFYYSLKEHEIIEFIGKKLERKPKKWKDFNELKLILQNIFKGNYL